MEENNELMDFPFEETILWEYSPSKLRTFFHSLKYACLGLVPFLLAGVIMALTGVILWKGFFLLFGGASLFAFLICCIALSKQVRWIYTITENEIIIDYPATICVAEFSNIKNITKVHSLFNRNVGTIKFKLKNRFSLNYQFAQIDDVDTVYDMLISLWEKHK